MAGVWYEALTGLLRNRADLVGSAIPAMMMPGESYACSITMQNSGFQTWYCSPNETVLTVRQEVGPVAHALLPAPYLQISINPCEIDIGQSCTFPFTVDVPADAPLGPYEITWQMKDHEEWFNSDSHSAVFSQSVAVRLYPVYKGDFDDDGDVDLEDFGHFQSCLSGLGVAQDDPACQAAEFDGDRDVDLADLRVFIGCLSGANIRPDPQCID